MTVLDSINDKLADALNCSHLEVVNESYMHRVPDGSQSHFKVVLVSADFAGQTRIKRHRMINQLLRSQFDEGLHALAIHAYTEDEWRARNGDAPMSPPCRGGSAS